MRNPYKRIRVKGSKDRDEHRHFMEVAIGRKLKRSELVHHKNGKTRDNRLENLEIVSPKQHAKIHLQKHPDTKRCAFCGKIFEPGVNHRARTKTCSKLCKYSLLSVKFRNPSLPKSMYRPTAYPSEREAQFKKMKTAPLADGIHQGLHGDASVIQNKRDPVATAAAHFHSAKSYISNARHVYLYGEADHLEMRRKIYERAKGMCETCQVPHFVPWKIGEWHHTQKTYGGRRCDGLCCALWSCEASHPKRRVQWSRTPSKTKSANP